MKLEHAILIVVCVLVLIEGAALILLEIPWWLIPAVVIGAVILIALVIWFALRFGGGFD